MEGLRILTQLETHIKQTILLQRRLRVQRRGCSAWCSPCLFLN